ncbi:MAG TPA: AMP-binding protein [Acidisarcina sp.]|nr:AMP-binding protein [Acidisarcina sp.]
MASLVEDFRRHGSQIAVVVYRGNRRYATTYTELASLAGRFSAELARRGVHPGERVVLWGANSAEWIAAFFGCLLRGVIAVPLDAAGSSEFASRVIADVRPQLIVGDRELFNALPAKAPQLRFADLAASLPASPLFLVDTSVSAQTPLQIIFTSGTTAEPKGIVHTHRNVLASLEPIEREIEKYRKYERFVHPLRFLHSLPLSHVFGQFMGLWIPALLAAEVHFDSQLEPARLVETIRRERISLLAAVPRVLEILRTHLLNDDPSLERQIAAAQADSIGQRWWRFRKVHRAFGLKFWALVCGGASLPADLEHFWSALGFALIQGYGLTETAALITLNHPFHIGRGTIGKPLPGREVRIREDGEILVRGEMLSSATWQGGKLQPRHEEWFATGDLAEQDASGQLRFKGRKGDVIVSPSGMNIHPADLEAALAGEPGMRGCAVVACPVPGGMEPVAVVLFSGDDDQLLAAVRNANSHLASHQQIRRWLRWPQLDLPRTSTGKLLRRTIAEWACAALSERSHPSNKDVAPTEDPLLQLIFRLTGESIAGTTDASLLSEDLHLDSLGRMQLQSALEEKLGIELRDNAIENLQTVGELRSLLGVTSSVVPPVASAAGSSQAVPASSVIREEYTYPHWPWSLPVRILRTLFLEAVMRPLVWLLAAPRVVRDTSSIPDQPLLVIANHVTALDGALVLYALPAKLRRRVAIAMSGEMLLDLRKARNQGNWILNLLGPVEYWLLTALFNVFPLPRLSVRRSFAHAGEALDRGYSVLIFPEGQRSPDGRLQAFRAGIGLLAQESRVPILPVALKGLAELKVGTVSWFRSGRLVIHVGTVLPFAEAADPVSLTHALEDVVSRLGSRINTTL